MLTQTSGSDSHVGRAMPVKPSFLEDTERDGIVLCFIMSAAAPRACAVPISAAPSPRNCFFLRPRLDGGACAGWEDRTCRAAATRVAFSMLTPSVFLSPCGKCYLLIILTVAVKTIFYFFFRLGYNTYLGLSCIETDSHILCSQIVFSAFRSHSQYRQFSCKKYILLWVYVQ